MAESEAPTPNPDIEELDEFVAPASGWTGRFLPWLKFPPILY